MPPDRPAGRRWTLAGAVLGLAAALGLALLVLIGSPPPERGLNQLALPLVYAVPGLLALLSLRERPVLLVSATALSLLLSITALSGVTLILLVPAACYGLALHHRRGWRPSHARHLLAGTLPLFAVLGAFAVIVVGIGQRDPQCWTYEEDADGKRTYTDVACDKTGDVGSIMQSGPATTITTPGQRQSGAVAPPRSGSSGSGAFGSEVFPPPGPGIMSSGGGSASDSTSALEAAAGAALIAAGLAAGWAASRPGPTKRWSVVPSRPGR